MTKKTLIALGAVGALCMAFVQNANALEFGDARDLGSIEFGIPSGDADRESYVNYLIDMASPSPSTYDAVTGQTYTRTTADPAGGVYPDAVFASNGNDGASYDVGSGGYLYLFAKYDGPNAGAEVWYIGGLTGTITIPTDGLPPDSYGLSGVTFFNPGTSVPDGGSTMMLLGAALAGLGTLRRFIKA